MELLTKKQEADHILYLNADANAKILLKVLNKFCCMIAFTSWGIGQ